MHAVRASYVAAREVLRSLVAEWAGTLPSEVRLERTPLGALYLPDYPLASCSLSHTSGVVMATLRPNGPVGVDLETISRPIGDLGALIGMACTESEQVALGSGSGAGALQVPTIHPRAISFTTRSQLSSHLGSVMPQSCSIRVQLSTELAGRLAGVG